MKKSLSWLAISTTTALTIACGGGGGGGHSGGGGGSSGGSGSVLYYPYETVYGDVCSTMEPTPGCTFNRSNGTRVTVVKDPHYNDYGHGSDDLWYVEFHSDGTADVFDEFGDYVRTSNISSFAGWVGGNTIGVGTTGLFWENVSGGRYWLGKNGVLYNANVGESNYGEAINSKESEDASDSNFAALSSDANKALVARAAQNLVKEYGFKQEKAQAVASALNSWAVASAERGYTTTKDMDKTFKAVFGVNFSSALAAVKELGEGSPDAMRDMTKRSASALGLKPQQAQKFVKGMYKKALASWGYDADAIAW